MVNLNEVVLKDGANWLHFSKAEKIFRINNFAEVIPTINTIEEIVNINNLYAAGFISYCAAPAFDKALAVKPSGEFPLLYMGIYQKPKIINNFVNNTTSFSTNTHLQWMADTRQNIYEQNINKIREYIAQGETYQVNYSLRFLAKFKNDDFNFWQYFLYLCQSQNRFGAYIKLQDYTIASASPELFFELSSDDIFCRPMKGTCPRGVNNEEDNIQKSWLYNSEKNRAENLMIVDMIRNDLSKIAVVGSVQVDDVFSLEKYPTLWQMTSKIRAKTNAGLSDVLKALFPCASITGAPKVQTMAIINKLETSPRNIYTGAIGYIAPNRLAKFSVAIRTVLFNHKDETAEYGAGGGIVWDSQTTEEYNEVLLKAQVLSTKPHTFELFETILWTPEDGYFLFDEHINRLFDSCQYFDFPINKNILTKQLSDVAMDFREAQRVRLCVNKSAEVNITYQNINIKEFTKTLNVKLGKSPVNSSDVFLYHKTTNRKIYNEKLAEINSQNNFDDVLLYNEHNQLTEFSIGNLVVLIDNKFFTPPVSAGLLCGTFREHLLKTKKILERNILVSELNIVCEIYLINSLRRWQKVRLSH